jgi:hydrogenase nickel incorporation protein HypA/HybF
MHEYSIVEALISRVAEEAAARGASGVSRLYVKIGALSGVEPELLAAAYETFRERTVCAGAELKIERVEERWACPQCGRTVVRAGALRCPECGRPGRLVEGDEIVLERIEMEVP